MHFSHCHVAARHTREVESMNETKKAHLAPQGNNQTRAPSVKVSPISIHTRPELLLGCCSLAREPGSPALHASGHSNHPAGDHAASRSEEQRASPSTPATDGSAAAARARSELINMGKRTAEKSYGGMAACTSSSELSENNPRQNFRLGDITWVMHDGSSWWPAQVIDEASVGSKPKKKTSHHALVRLYGTCLDLYVDPWKSNMDFEMFLKEENKTAMEAFHEVLQKELSHFESASDHDEEAVNTKAKTSTKKARKQEGLEQDQEARSNAKSGSAVQKGKKQKGVRQASALDKALSLSEDSGEGLRDKTSKQASVVRDKKSGKKAPSGTSVVRKEGSSKRSGRTGVKEYSDASEDKTSQLHDTSASKNAAEVGDMRSVNQSQHKTGSTVDGTHRKIKAMVRDILLGDVIDRQLAAEMAYVDEVIFGICEATEAKATGGATTTETEGGLSNKRDASGLDANSSRAGKKPKKGKAKKPETKDPKSTPSRAVAGSEQRSARQIKIMQSLGLIAPSGSPFDGKGGVAVAHR